MAIRIQRSNYFTYGITVLELSGPDTEVQIKFMSRKSKYERRAQIRAFLTQIKPALKDFTTQTIDHSNTGEVTHARSKAASLGKAAYLGTTQAHPYAKYGHRLRLKRLQQGLNQTELAKILEIQRSHVSSIEQGLHFPQLKTRLKIQSFLSTIESSPD